MNKTREDVELVIFLGKPGAVIAAFFTDYLTGLALQPYLEAEAQYAAFQAQPDQPDIIDPETQEVVSSPNADRDAALAALEQQYPYMVDPGDDTTLADRRPEPDLDMQIAEARELALIRAKQQFAASLAGGICNLSLGWPIDVRRGSGTDDVGNMQGLLRLAQHGGLADADQVAATGIKGADGAFHPVTVAELRDVVIPEMDAYGLSLYADKWLHESQIATAATVAEVLEVI